jgi:hypothetical protein
MDAVAAKRLWIESERLTKVKFGALAKADGARLFAERLLYVGWIEERAL